MTERNHHSIEDLVLKSPHAVFNHVGAFDGQEQPVAVTYISLRNGEGFPLRVHCVDEATGVRLEELHGNVWTRTDSKRGILGRIIDRIFPSLF